MDQLIGHMTMPCDPQTPCGGGCKPISIRILGQILRNSCLSLSAWFLILAGGGAAADTGAAFAQAPAPIAIQSTASVASPAGLHFRDISVEAGLTTRSSTDLDRRYVFDMTGGGGVALFDCDNDGRLDIAVANDSSIPRYLAGGDPLITLYRQDGKKGALHFQDVTAASGLTTKGWATGLVVADFDNDGLPDLFVTGYPHNVLYRNLGDCKFQDVTEKAHLMDGGFSAGAAWADYDRDGFVDLYVVRYVDTDPTHPIDPKIHMHEGILMEVPGKLKGDTNLLYHNRGDGTFEEVSAKAGVDNQGKLHGMGISWGDYDGDGWPDLFVTNDGNYNFLFHNLRNGTFEDVGILSGVAAGEHGEIYGNMAGDFGDFDRDGKMDIFAVRYAHQPASLYWNQGDGQFRDIAGTAGIALPSTPVVKWGEGFGDFDNDGWLDLVIANGNFSTLLEPLPGEPAFGEPMELFRNRGNRTFEEVATPAGLNSGKLQSRRGVAIGDLDNDGRLDMVVFNVGEPPTLFHNETVNKNHWLGLRLIGQKSNRSAIGARARLTTCDGSMIDEVHGGGSYLSMNDLRLHFGLGKCSTVAGLEVAWPSGLTQTLKDLAPDQIYTLTEGKSPVSSGR